VDAFCHVAITNTVFTKVKGKVNFVDAMKACRGVEVVAPLILNLGTTRWR
jgi:hypothetical protein